MTLRAFGSYFTAAYHIVGSLIIAYLFVSVLISASTQAGVADRLKRHNPPLEYSTAYAAWNEARISHGRIAARRARHDELAGEVEQSRTSEVRAGDVYDAATAPLMALHGRLSTIRGCAFDPERRNPIDIAVAINVLRQCLNEAGLAPTLGSEVERVLGSEAVMLDKGHEWLRLRRESDRLEARLEQSAGEIQRMEDAQRNSQEIRDSFSELAVLERNSWLGGGILAELPPSIIQIVLAFVSGLFGALLITLVLIVYPKSNLQLTSPGGGYGARILLGGLISLCVFIVLGGGTAVLGAASAFAESEANFLAFCAIGILAGMFSDRVAFWLSSRADTFFRDDQREEQEVAAVAARQPLEPVSGSAGQAPKA